MTGLAETISRLAEFRAKLPITSPGSGRDRLTDLDDFGSNPGNLRARLYLPADLPENAPLVVVLHGCTQTAAGYDTGTGWSVMADRHGFALLFPEQRRANNQNLCFNWFLPQHTGRDQGEALSISQMVQTVRLRHRLDPDRTFVTGLSAGGAMASVMLATYPDLFAGGAVIAGLPFGAASSMPEAFAAMQGSSSMDGLADKVRSASRHQGSWPIVSVWHGAGDKTVAAVNGEAVVEQWRGIHGLPLQPSHTAVVGSVPRRTWRNDEGREVLEEYVVPRMGHGTPVDGTAEGGIGGAYMLDVGVSSTQEIARFWGIADGGLPRTATRKPEARSATPLPLPAARGAQSGIERRLHPEESPPHAPAHSGIGKVINDALRAAGLMR